MDPPNPRTHCSFCHSWGWRWTLRVAVPRRLIPETARLAGTDLSDSGRREERKAHLSLRNGGFQQLGGGPTGEGRWGHKDSGNSPISRDNRPSDQASGATGSVVQRQLWGQMETFTRPENKPSQQNPSYVPVSCFQNPNVEKDAPRHREAEVSTPEPKV